MEKRKMFFVYLLSKHSEQQTLIKNAILCLKRHDIWLFASTHESHNTQHSMLRGYVVRGVGWGGGSSDISYCCYHDNHPGKVSLHNAKQWRKCRKREFDKDYKRQGSRQVIF